MFILNGDFAIKSNQITSKKEERFQIHCEIGLRHGYIIILIFGNNIHISLAILTF